MQVDTIRSIHGDKIELCDLSGYRNNDQFQIITNELDSVSLDNENAKKLLAALLYSIYGTDGYLVNYFMREVIEYSRELDDFNREFDNNNNL
jgi:hypothetical protein